MILDIVQFISQQTKHPIFGWQIHISRMQYLQEFYIFRLFQQILRQQRRSLLISSGPINLYFGHNQMEAQRATESHLEQQPSPQYLAQRLHLEGQCRITKCVFLKFSLIKSVLLFVLLTISVVGLLLLKYYKSLRAKVFYFESNSKQATHIFVQGTAKREQEIIKIQKGNTCQYFYYKRLKYELIDDKSLPFGLDYQAYLKDRLTEEYLRTGLSPNQVKENMEKYDKNEHIVDPPTYFEYLYEVMTEPFFFIQYLAAVIYIFEKMPELSILLIGASIITTSINYVILYISYRKIKEIAEVVVTVSALRNGQFSEIPSSQLVPGDIFIPRDELFCDVLLLKGELYVNQSNLTGESIPIGKYGFQQYKNYKAEDNSKWIYEGSKILSAKNPLALVVHTGYSSKRGRILRKILHRNSQVPHFFTTFIYFLVELFIIGALAYISTLYLRLHSDNLERIVILLNFLLVVTFCFPPSTPIYFNLVYSFSLLRLKWNNILGTEPQKTVEGAHLRIMCFDKTGTLTEDKVEVNRAIKFHSHTYSEITPEEKRTCQDYKLFASCHTVKEFEGELMGDEIDLKTFLYSRYKLKPSTEPSICFQVEQKEVQNPNRIKIIKIYQYQSRFQSMSVLAFDCRTNQHFVFVKGAPEIIHKHSLIKYPYFQQLLQTESYGGFRTIGYGLKKVDEDDLKEMMQGSRQSHLKGIHMYGMLAFENKLKHDASEIMVKLAFARIQPRMITGDNVYIAIETAMRCGILERKTEVMVLEGKQQNIPAEVAERDICFNAKILKFQNNNVSIRVQKLSFEEYIESHHPIVIDNDFLKATHNIRLSPKIKVYSRISPQNKALIVRRIRQQLSQKRKQLRLLDRLFSEQQQKVGMVGDGANDLLAIKQANIGIGIRNCDSSYAASFSILNLSDIDYIIRESKCAEREIIEICRFMAIGAFITVPIIIIMETEASFFSSSQLVFNNFTKFLIFPILLALSRPAPNQTPFKPASNFLKKQNQLFIWGNVIISTLGFAATCIFMRSRSQYVWNTARADLNSGWTSNDHLVASEFLYFSLQPVILIMALYQSSPWKEPIYKNILLFLVFLLNLIFQIGYYFIQPDLSSLFGVPSLSYQSLVYLFIIGAVTSMIALLYSLIIAKMQLHTEQSRPCIQGKEGMMELPRTGSSSQNERF